VKAAKFYESEQAERVEGATKHLWK